MENPTASSQCGGNTSQCGGNTSQRGGNTHQRGGYRYIPSRRKSNKTVRSIKKKGGAKRRVVKKTRRHTRKH